MRGKKPPPPKKEEKSGRSSPVKAVDTLTPTTSSASINKLTAKRQANDLIAKTNPKSTPPTKAPAVVSKKPKPTPSKPENKVKPSTSQTTSKPGDEKDNKAKKEPVTGKKKPLALKKNVSKKVKEQLRSQKISNELKNLGVNLLDHSFCSESSSSDSRQSFDVKASICEMVKTKSRTSVCQATTTAAKPVTKKIVKKEEEKKEDQKEETKAKVEAGKAKPTDTVVDKAEKEPAAKEDVKATKKPTGKKPAKKPEVAKVQETTEKPQVPPTNETPSLEKQTTKEETEKKVEVKKPPPAKKQKVVKEKPQTAPIEQTTKSLEAENDKAKPSTSKDIEEDKTKPELIEEQIQKKSVKKKPITKESQESKPTEEPKDSNNEKPSNAEPTANKVPKPKKAAETEDSSKPKSSKKTETKAEDVQKESETAKEHKAKKTYKKKVKEVKADEIKETNKEEVEKKASNEKDPLELATETPVTKELPEGTSCKLIPSTTTVEKVVKKPKAKNPKPVVDKEPEKVDDVPKIDEKKAVKKKKSKNDEKEPKPKKSKESNIKQAETTGTKPKDDEQPSTSAVETEAKPEEPHKAPTQEPKSSEPEANKPITGEGKPAKKKKVVKELTPEEAYQKKQLLLEKRRIRAAAKREELRKIKAQALASLTDTTPAATPSTVPPSESQKIFVKSIESLQDPLKIPEPLPAPVIITMEPSPPATIEIVNFKPDDEEKDSEKEDSRPLSTFTSTTIKTEAASTTALPETNEPACKPESPKKKYIKKTVGSDARNLEPGTKKSLVESTKKEDIYEFHDSGSDALSPMPITKKPTFKPSKKLVGAKAETEDEGQASDTEKIEKKPKASKSPKAVKKPETSKYLKKIQEKEKLKKLLEQKESQDEDTGTDQSSESGSDSSDSDDTSKTIKTRLFEKRASAKNRKILLYGFWKGPKRHRVASLNAIAKVHCLYENESRVALEQSLIKAAKIASLRDAAKLQQGTSSDEDEDDNDISVTKRSLRTAPGLRGVGKLWEFNDSSLSSAEEAISDSELKMKKMLKDKLQGSKKNKKTSSPKKIGISKASKASHSLAKAKVSSKKAKMKKLKKIIKRSESDKSKDERGSSDSEDSDCQKSHGKKRKHTTADIPSDFKDVGVRKRMASLNASAMLAASYEVERHCNSSYDSDSSVEVPQAPKKVKEVKHEAEEVRPVSTNLVIVQDTDVTITGMYVNSSAGSSQESYCKMQYRVQSSVTEERVVRASSQEAPKSYTPLTALSSMRPPGSQESSLSASSSQYSQPSQCEASADNAPMGFPPPPPVPPSSQPPYPPPPHLVASSTSAFCAPPPTPHHHDPTGYYQPAGPLISSHLLPPQQQAPPPTKPLDAESHQLLQQPPQSTSTADSTDSDVLITGGDLTPRPQTFHYGPQTPGLYARPPVHQMHCPTYPPNYYSPYAQHPQEMCYPQPYQPYYPQKVYPSTPPYRRYMPGPYYPHQGPPPPSEMYEQPPPSSAPPPPNQSQLVPAGPSGPQHPMDHYPYYGYSPGPGGQCYSRPPYMDAPSYQNTCPCPMQSCPKNVHTGPLIGSNKTSKGPVSTNSNPIVANPHEPAVVATTQTVTSTPPSATANTVGQSTAKKVLCKQENGGKGSGELPATIKIKGENGVAAPLVASNPHQHHIGGHLYPYHHGAVPLMRPAPMPPHKEGTTYEKIALAPLPNYALNSNMNEPEQSISPARGSTGLSLPPVPAEAAQPVIDTGSLPTKRPRIGKSMERERQMMMIHSQAPTSDSCPSSPSSPTHQPSYEPHINSSVSLKTGNTTSDTSLPNHTDLTIVKQEIKEEVDHQMIKTETLSDCESKEDYVVKRVEVAPTPPVPAPATPVTPTKTKFSIDALIEPTPTPRRQLLLPKYDDDVCEVINLDESSSPLPDAPSLKRRKLLANMNTVKQPKKSPPNSYKNLIKRPESRNAACIYVDGDDDVVETEVTSVPSPEPEPAVVALKKFKALKKKKKKRKKNAVLKLKPRLVGISKKAKKNNKKLRKVAEKEIKEHRDREEKLAKLKQLEMHEPIDIKPEIVDISEDKTDEAETPPPSMAQQIFKTNIENTIDMVARGYFSEPEMAAVGTTGSMHPRVLKKLKSQEKPRSKSLTKKEKPAQLVDVAENAETDSAKATAPTKDAQAPKSKRSKSKSKEMEEEAAVEEDAHNLVNINNNTIKMALESDEAKAAKKAKAAKTKKKSKEVEKAVEEQVVVVVEEDATNNNNEVVDEKIVQTIGAHIAQLATAMAESKQACTESDEAEQRPTKVPAARKRSKSRSSKFSSRKRHRASMTAEVDPPVVMPRKANAAPRWSNGWSWEGQSFQGKVFLNSDDLPVIRTCYPAMRHASGDIIRPRDSVLLRAGGKKGQELPYVAKVAYLWENPEDGEMMMSLLWYYRPEHTEQGRQPNDDVCEVFASRHKDHNSVACIEDKCFVLTYNEYCRYRRRLRMLEENMVETPSIVPPLIHRDYSRPQVPAQTPTDLVMYCRRVYEFRLKRLMKQPN